MHPLKAVIPLVAAVALVTAGPAVAKSDGPGKHHGHHTVRKAGGGAPPILPSIVRVRINRGEAALNRAGDYIDRNKPDKAVTSLLNARRNMYAAWKGAVYVIQTAPPPPASAGSVHTVHRVEARKSGTGATGPVYADPPTTAVAVLGFQHDVATAAYGMTDGAKGTLLGAVNTTIFAALDRRDAAIQYIHNLPPAPTAASVHAHAAGTGAGVTTFDTLMPGVLTDVQDEVQQIQGVLQGGAVTPEGKKILKDALVQDIMTSNTINTFWPPVPAA